MVRIRPKAAFDAMLPISIPAIRHLSPNTHPNALTAHLSGLVFFRFDWAVIFRSDEPLVFAQRPKSRHGQA